jgi:hypothetical protein
MKEVRYHMQVAKMQDDEETMTMHVLTIDGSRKQRKRKFAAYVKEAYGVTNPNQLARQMGFKDLL